MTKTGFIFMFIFIGLLSLQGQVRKISIINKSSENRNTRLSIPVSHRATASHNAETEDSGETALYRDIIRKHTWYEGVGDTITQEVANRLPYYFRLSMRNRQGHWQHVQAMHQDSMTSKHNISPYVIDKKNAAETDNIEWRINVNRITQWFMTSDLSGNEIVEERAYDKDGTLIYSFIPVKISDNTIVGSYNDAWGLPADMRSDSTTTYGSVVSITYDRCGRDSVINYLDGQGLGKYNPNGVDRECYLYDDKDRVIRVTSHNVTGDNIRDNWGNCGNLYIYDDENNICSVIRVDENLEPMRMPSLRASGLRTFIRCDTRKDEYGRDVESVFMDEFGNNDTTSSGLHKIVYRYAPDGVITETTYYDIEGNVMTEENASR